MRVLHEHPQSKSVPGMMSCAEIRFYLAWLLDNGWSTTSLQNAIGCSKRQAVWDKAKGDKWIYPSEQPRFSRQIKRILAGELVRGKRATVVVADRPRPLRPPARMVFTGGRLRWIAGPELPKPALRSFRDIFDNPKVTALGTLR